MGLDVSHGCFSGPYSKFHRFREKICETAGYGDLNKMQGFSENGKPWPQNNDKLIVLLTHSDFDGTINNEDCLEIANRLKELLPSMKNAGFENETVDFIEGLEFASSEKEHVWFK